MPDLLAGQRIKALDFTPTVSDSEPTAFTTTSTTFTASGGNVCGVAFVAPTTGRVLVRTNATLGANNASIGVEVTPVVRDGSSVGSGSDIVAASSANAARYFSAANQASGDRHGVDLLVTGLTPGDPYNVQLEHRTSGGTATITNRHVIVEPAT